MTLIFAPDERDQRTIAEWVLEHPEVTEVRADRGAVWVGTAAATPRQGILRMYPRTGDLIADLDAALSAVTENA